MSLDNFFWLLRLTNKAMGVFRKEAKESSIFESSKCDEFQLVILMWSFW